jgi:hypothetical protein
MSDYYDFERYERNHGARVLTGEDWRLGRRPTGRSTRYRFVDPDTENRTKEEWPYSYSSYFLWGSAEKGCEVVYSDRLAQWDSEKSKAALAAVADENCRYGYWSTAGTSKYLTAYFGKPIEAVAVAEGCNVSSGYPYWIFWFRDAAIPPSHCEAGDK